MMPAFAGAFALTPALITSLANSTFEDLGKLPLAGAPSRGRPGGAATDTIRDEAAQHRCACRHGFLRFVCGGDH